MPDWEPYRGGARAVLSVLTAICGVSVRGESVKPLISYRTIRANTSLAEFSESEDEGSP